MYVWIIYQVERDYDSAWIKFRKVVDSQAKADEYKRWAAEFGIEVEVEQREVE